MVAVFDFDDTLIRRDTMKDFLLQTFGVQRFFWNCFTFLPSYISFKSGRISRSESKQRLLGKFFKGMKTELLDTQCLQYADRLNELANPDGLERLAWHIQRGDAVVIESASLENWILPWATQHGVATVLATRLMVEDGVFTGTFFGENCFGPEKAIRLLGKFPDRESYELFAYGDGHSDKDLFAIADRVFASTFAEAD